MPNYILTVPSSGIMNDPHNGDPVYIAVIRAESTVDAVLHVLQKYFLAIIPRNPFVLVHVLRSLLISLDPTVGPLTTMLKILWMT